MGAIGDYGAELKEQCDKNTANSTHKCDQVERKCQGFIQVATTEKHLLNQKEIEPLTLPHNTMKNLVKELISPRLISIIDRLETPERSPSIS